MKVVKCMSEVRFDPQHPTWDWVISPSHHSYWPNTRPRHEFVGRPKAFQEKQRKWRKAWREQEAPFAKMKGEDPVVEEVEEHQERDG